MAPVIYDCEQGTPEWHMARLGIPTASEFRSIIAKGEGRTRRTYMMKLISERFTGESADYYSNHHMERGKALEDEARRLYALLNDVEPKRVGFIRNGEDDYVVGCSPDSLIGDTGMLEIKTKLGHLQVEALLAGKVPAEHVPQIQGQLWVAEREYVDFVSYWPKLPLLVRRITRDEQYINMLAKEVAEFWAELDKYTAQLEHGGAVRWLA